LKPELREAIVKLNDGVSGEGNAIVDLVGLPAPGRLGEDRLIERRLRGLAPEADGVSPARYLARFTTQGGVVEERLTGPEVRSPSAQLQITPSGRVELLSTHDQILAGPGGQTFQGCRFPADPAYGRAIAALAVRIAERLAAVGVIGRFAVDFVTIRLRDGRWEPFAIELNLRMGGTTHTHQALAGLTGGAYDPASVTFRTPGGDCKHYVATDHLEAPRLRRLGRSGVLRLGQSDGLRFDPDRQVGAVFHMLSSVAQLGRVGFTAIADSPEEADALYARVYDTLIRSVGTHRLRLLSEPLVASAFVSAAT
jgi:hypothetical protein